MFCFGILGWEPMERQRESRDDEGRTNFNLGSFTLKPIIMPRGIEPALCRFVNDDQN